MFAEISSPGGYTGFFLYALLAICVSLISGKLSFCHFGTEFSNNWEVFRWECTKNLLFQAIFGENIQKYPVFEGFGSRVVKYPDVSLPGSTGIKSLLPGSGSGYSIPVHVSDMKLFAHNF